MQSNQPLYSQFLTEVMGLCFHDAKYISWEEYVCTKCGSKDRDALNIDFSTGNGFILLWNWCIGQEWWNNFGEYVQSTRDWVKYLIHPNRFAETIYNFLKDNNINENYLHRYDRQGSV